MITGSTKNFLKWKNPLKIKSLKLRYWNGRLVFGILNIFFQNQSKLFSPSSSTGLFWKRFWTCPKYCTPACPNYFESRRGQGFMFFNKNLKWKSYKSESHGMCYSHLGNGVRNGSISITKWGFINYRCKVNPVSQWGKILVTAMGFVDYLVRAQSYLKELDL